MSKEKFVPLSELRSCTEFKTDAEYQDYCKKLWKKHGLDDNPKVNFAVSMRTGKVTYHKRKKEHVPIIKISKSP